MTKLKQKSIAIAIFLCLSAGISSFLIAGITGTLSGRVIDGETGLVLPGAAILVEGTTVGTMAGKNGDYVIYNLPAGTYDVSVTMIGYSKLTIKNVTINADLTTKISFELSAKVLALDEVVITEQKKLIQSDVTSSTYFISGQEITEQLPVDGYLDAMGLLPGVVGNHIRGGRNTDVLYMLDGLPIQSGLSRQITSYFPNSSIVEMMVQTGGFSAEYGQATSGVVNVVSKDGRNEVDGDLRIYSDFVQTALADNDNTRRLDFNLGGPMTIGLGGPLINANYFIAADLNLSDTAQRKQLRDAFDSPIFSNYNINSKLSFDIARNTILSLQGLVSNWRWRQLDSQWALNPSGIALNKHNSKRFSISLTHTFSPKFFASVRYGNYSTIRQVLGNAGNNPPQLVFEDPADASSLILSGDQPLEEETREKIHIAKLDLVGQVSEHHLLKAGIEVQDYRLETDAVKYEPVTRKNSANQVNTIAYNRLEDDYSYGPGSFALYLQDKISFKGVTANLGLRYDVIAPNIHITDSPDNIQLIQLQLASSGEEKSKKHKPFSPRLGLSLPLSGSERLHVNYGWYYQMPPLFYYYANSSRNNDGHLPLFGNVDLEPTKTISSEFSYKRSVGDDMLFVLTGFNKRFESLVDTRVFLLPDTAQGNPDGTLGFSQYTNSGSAKALGFEVTLQKRITQALFARISYTYMKAKGTSSSAEDSHQRALNDTELQISDGEEFPLSWDQRHSMILNANYLFRKIQFNILYRLLSPLPVNTDESITPNDKRLSWRNMIDLRVSFSQTKLFGQNVKPFLEVRNLLNQNNIIDVNSRQLGVEAYRLFDPINANLGRRLRLGMNIDF